MEKARKIFTECPVLGGFTLTVRDDWSYKLKQVSVTNEEKDAYLSEIGNEIITYGEFFEWWRNFIKKKVPTVKVGLA